MIDSPWSHTAGRPRAVTKSDIESLVTEFERGAAYDSSAVKKRLLSKRANLVHSSGGIPVVEDSLATTTVSKYICAVANHCGVSIVNKATNKLRTQINLGKSKRRLGCYIGLLGSVMFVYVAEEDRNIQTKELVHS